MRVKHSAGAWHVGSTWKYGSYCVCSCWVVLSNCATEATVLRTIVAVYCTCGMAFQLLVMAFKALEPPHSGAAHFVVVKLATSQHPSGGRNLSMHAEVRWLA